MPSKSTEHRKLTSVMIIDWLGYVALAQRYESLATLRLNCIQAHVPIQRRVLHGSEATRHGCRATDSINA